ncbi:histidine kinase dimerization/phospho-acceptor domain-containing protein [Indioceanicola profundi]|uniref:histidine kinase dimerization/phospho-acceptor domain-containing protein n=1 Tax=Indioceanicola profundi TaxID=2220096 RepID=UPI0013C40B74|nr:histidine kinase dimerization/phospho-acceptor domain-containing protein [Indioceanicola profundi]
MDERRKTEEALRQSEKLQALGQLTGGIAHDFNNLLQVVHSGVELLRRGKEGPVERRAMFLDSMAQAVERAKELTGQLLTFSRRQAPKPQVFNLNERLLGMARLLDRTLGPKITVRTELAADLWLM